MTKPGDLDRGEILVDGAVAGFGGGAPPTNCLIPAPAWNVRSIHINPPTPLGRVKKP